MGDDPAQLGYPDDGNGRYMQAKPYGDWYFFAVAKRVYRTDIEHLVTMIPMSLVNGFVLPYPTIGLLSAYLLGRTLYTQGCFEKEGALNSRRMMGSALCNLGHVGTLAVTMVIGYRLARGKLIRL